MTIQGVGQGGGGLAKAAIEAALKAQANSAQRIEQRIDGAFGPAGSVTESASKPDFAKTLLDGIKTVDDRVRDVDTLPLEVASGKINDFAELAGRLKQSEMTFKFALEVRNKLIDAYRETMRMSV